MFYVNAKLTANPDEHNFPWLYEFVPCVYMTLYHLSIPCVFMTLCHWSLNLNKIIWHLVSTPKENKRKIMSICVKLTLFCRIIWKCTMLVSELHTCIIWLSYFRVLLQSMYVHTISNLCCRIGVKMRLDFTIFFNMYIKSFFGMILACIMASYDRQEGLGSYNYQMHMKILLTYLFFRLFSLFSLCIH